MSQRMTVGGIEEYMCGTLLAEQRQHHWITFQLLKAKN